jgi:hypothetical protein
MTAWDMDTIDETQNETLYTTCEDMQNTYSSVWEMLNKILSENEDEKGEGSCESSHEDDVGTP